MTELNFLEKSHFAAFDRVYWSLQDLGRNSIVSNPNMALIAILSLKFIWERAVLEGSKLPSWASILHEAGEAGPRLDRLGSIIEDKFEPLRGIFRDGLLHDVDRWPQDFIRQVISHLSAVALDVSPEEEVAPFARWFDIRLAEILNSGRMAGEVVTPDTVAELMIALASLERGQTVLDPCCGAGSVLSRAARLVNVPAHANTVFGEEKNIESWAICKLRLFLLGFSSVDIALGDSLRQPAFLHDGRLRKFDRVLCDTPLGFELRREELDAPHLWAMRFGELGRVSGESAFVQHCLSSLKEDGIAIVVVSHSLLFRTGADVRLRERLIESGLIRAVVGLPGKLRSGTSIETALLVCGKHDSEGVYFIDATAIQERSRGRMELSENSISRIRELFSNRTQEEGLSRIVGLQELHSNKFSLVPKHYISPIVRKRQDTKYLFQELDDLEAEHDEVIRNMDSLLEEMRPGKGIRRTQ